MGASAPCFRKVDMKLVIATPFYEVKAYSPYITALLNSVKALNELNIEWDYYQLAGDSYVDRAKNTLVHKFMESDNTHLFMIDSDLNWDVKGFMRLIMAAKAGADVVGGTFPNKNLWNTFGVQIMTDEEGNMLGYEKDNMRLLEANCMPGGFLIYSRKAFEMAQPYIKKYVQFEGEKAAKQDYSEPIYNYEYFCCAVENDGDGRVGEDVYFQNKFRQAGGKLYIEPKIDFEHWGVKGWKGNYHEYLLRQRTIREAKGEVV